MKFKQRSIPYRFGLAGLSTAFYRLCYAYFNLPCVKSVKAVLNPNQ